MASVNASALNALYGEGSTAESMLWQVWEHFAYMFYLVPWWSMETDPSQINSLKYTARSTATFFALIFVELVVSILKGVKLYRFEDMTTSSTLGVVSMFVVAFTKILQVSTFVWIWENFHVVDITPGTPLDWVLCLLAADFCYYWLHRHHHEYHLFWWGHSVHHSGEDYNLSTALRQGIIQGIFGWVYTLPMALFLHPISALAHKQLNTLFQFWIHTPFIGRLGFLENFLNTPSHHRMHHRPPGNCNYAGVLIIWDRMFGTFVQEDVQKDYYGLAKPYTSHDPVWANVEHPWRLIANVDPNKERSASFFFSLLTKKRVKHKWVFNPLVLFQNLKEPASDLWELPKKPKREKLSTHISKSLYAYQVINFFFVMVVSVITLEIPNSAGSYLEIVLTQCLCALACMSFGRLFDGNLRFQTVKVITFLVVSYMLTTTQQSDRQKIAFDSYIPADVLFKISAADALLWSLVLVGQSIKSAKQKAS
uniref:Fatty acid hydroxylase domain-containing protein n=1 Tax=Aplanochytrium stocchinoi TaxID=215587 RepID=A0A7S3V2H5_9STRA|mmetsp:Transcript_7667/g.9742  ORF Transcript_7667/g.9742 Transcript_7667/m.9742 type:complete len:480 (-) Transcript_7667:129-1568(-)